MSGGMNEAIRRAAGREAPVDGEPRDEPPSSRRSVDAGERGPEGSARTGDDWLRNVVDAKRRGDD